MPGFVVEYHRPSGRYRVHEFSGEDGHRRALLLRFELEAERVDPDWEIASLNSDSIETLMKTHARYFADGELLRSA
ncbi:hypothetical protein [Microbacterium sp. SLBN-146]|uniref:hypothetical protein n=1 Tax=Microbacterium sp. SLBN-146 TaxID=2768457 RepID=UPI00115000C7|nr:hypothetical protein [Microbacterium sp. SLBN-146]TQJ30399.1 hypothetical protein FBY39_0851 [Microbacterium sp. SLBN-146]